MEPNYEIKHATIKYINAKQNYYKQTIHYFKFMDDSFEQLGTSYLWYRNPIFKTENHDTIIGILNFQNIPFTKNQIYTCNINLIDSPSPNPRIRSKYFYAKLSMVESQTEEDLFIDI